MSPRRRASRDVAGARGEPVSFDLGGLADDAPAVVAAPAPGTAPSRGGRRRRRALVVVVAAGAIVAAGLVVVAVVGDDRSEARLVAAPGGLLPLPDAPAETWSVDHWNGEGLVDRGSTLVLTGGSLTALDPATGAERWHLETGGPTWCGGSAGRDPRPGGWPLTCVSRDGDDTRVTLVDEGGTVVGRRDVTFPADLPLAALADGGVVSAERVGKPPAGGDGFEFDYEGSTHPSTLPAGRDVLVRATDAATGEPRWERTVPYVEPQDAWPCADWSGETPVGDVSVTQLQAVGGVVQVSGCGVDAAFSQDGTRLDDPATPDRVEALADGTILRTLRDDAGDRPISQEVLDAAGEVRWEVPGQAMVPAATDGTDGPGQGTWVVEDGAALSAYDADHTRRWSERTHVDKVLVQASGLVVVARLGMLVGLDLATGQERWRTAPEADPAGSEAFTDGASAIVTSAIEGRVDEDGEPVTDGTLDRSTSDATGPVGTRVTAYDLADGSVRWTTTAPSGADLEAVDGHLLSIEPRYLRGLG
ncbi:PQQ-binding-like beta-propeller repeat protein [Cellulomonas sp. PhB143]|uniref:outer membrane protein assembly factor BamB family protein n=1 Tax=Cellulomonas sp. PhB143 TaxID=2485186 RepID=UPI000FA36D9A|nr:PQQ-binding-like beta-propeller repeat protein [Cellulomonas sp. PhB143]ROS75368.1 putative pyrroloquinoline-quinone binding quinoprotein [Cellulomonas sp. PhB143]